MTSDDARNALPAGGLHRFQIYLALVWTGGVAVLAGSLTGPVLAPLREPAFVVLAVLLLLSELRPLFIAGSRDTNGVVISTTFAFAVLLHWGLGPAVVLHGVAAIAGDLVRGRALWRATFNGAQYALSWAAAFAVWVAVAPNWADQDGVTSAGGLLAVLLAGVTYFVVNNLLVAIALALYRGSRLGTEFFDGFGYQVLTTGSLLSLSPLVLVAAQSSAVLVPLLLLPLFAVYKNASMSVEKERQSLHDGLTGLPNRTLLLDSARTALAEARRRDGRAGVILLDLDRFKEVNDTLGHPVGDRLLQTAGIRLAGALRPGDVVARVGGDEFVVLLPSVRDEPAATDVAHRVCAALVEPFHLDDQRLRIDISAGLALFPDHGEDIETLLRRADVAMYDAKETRSRVQAYVPDRDRHAAQRLALVSDLRRALTEHELVLYFQPKVDLAGAPAAGEAGRAGCTVGVEALLRWRHPRHGLLLPTEFLPLAERAGLSGRITEYVLDEALAGLARWRRRHPDLHVAVNLAASDLGSHGFAEYVGERLRHWDVPPDRLRLEVADNVLSAEANDVEPALRALAALGVILSVDDLGAGWVNVLRLRRWPLHEVKLGPQLVAELGRDDDAEAVVRSVLQLAAALGLRVAAEGVESAAVRERLRVLGCAEAQGHDICPPLPAPEVTSWLLATARHGGDSPADLRVPAS